MLRETMACLLFIYSILLVLLMVSGREQANGTSQKIWNLGKRYENLGVCKTNWVIMTSPIRKSYVNDVCLWGLSFLCFPITCRHRILFAHEIMNKEVMIRLNLAYEAGVASWRLKNKGISEWKIEGLLVYQKSMTSTISSIQHRPMVGTSSPDSMFWVGLSFEGSIFTIGTYLATVLRLRGVASAQHCLWLPSLLLPAGKTAVIHIGLKSFSSSILAGITVIQQNPCLGERTFSWVCRGPTSWSMSDHSMNLKVISQSPGLLRGTQ